MIQLLILALGSVIGFFVLAAVFVAYLSFMIKRMVDGASIFLVFYAGSELALKISNFVSDSAYRIGLNRRDVYYYLTLAFLLLSVLRVGKRLYDSVDDGKIKKSIITFFASITVILLFSVSELTQLFVTLFCVVIGGFALSKSFFNVVFVFSYSWLIYDWIVFVLFSGMFVYDFWGFVRGRELDFVFFALTLIFYSAIVFFGVKSYLERR